MDITLYVSGESIDGTEGNPLLGIFNFLLNSRSNPKQRIGQKDLERLYIWVLFGCLVDIFLNGPLKRFYN